MKWVRLFFLLAVASTGAALRAPAEAATSPKRISIEYRGPLKDALKKIAAEGGINLVASGDLNQEAEVYLKGVSPEEALRTVANAYHLRIDQSGSIWTLRPMTDAERLSQPPSPPPPPPPPRDSEATEPAPRDRSEAKEEPSSPSDRAMRDAAEAIAKSHADHAPINPKLLRKRLREIGKHGRHPGSNDRVAQGSLVINEGETVRDAIALGGSLLVNGTVTGDASALGGSININGHVTGDAFAIGGSVHLGPNAAVDGSVIAFGGDISKDEGAEIGGDQMSSSGLSGIGIDKMMKSIIRDSVRKPDGDSEENGGRSHWLRTLHFGFPGFLIEFAFFFGLGLILMVFAPSRMHQIETDLKNEPLKCGLTGLVGLVALIPVLIILVLTLIGIAVVPVVLFLACLGIAMGMSAVANEIGMRLPFFRGRKTHAIVLAMGTLVLLLVAKVPVIGPLAIAVLMTLAFGAALRTRFGQTPKGVPQPI